MPLLPLIGKKCPRGRGWGKEAVLWLGIVLSSLGARESLGGRLSGIGGAFADVLPGIREGGMGGTGVALLGAEDALRINPALLVNVPFPLLTISAKRQFNLVNYYHLSLTFPARNGGWGGYILSSDDGIYSENTIGIGVGKSLSSLLPKLPIHFGLTVKLLTTSFGKDGVGEDRIQGSSWGLSGDIGFSGELGESLSWGIVLQDGVAEVRWKSEPYDRSASLTTYSQNPPRSLRMGIGYRKPWGSLAADYRPSLYSDGRDRLGLGIEGRWKKVIIMRAGIAQNLSGTDRNRWITAGLGIEAGGTLLKSLKVANINYFHLFHSLDHSPGIGLSLGW